MNLQEFIKETVTQICYAIKESNEILEKDGVGAKVNPKDVSTAQCYGVSGNDETVSAINFDVALTVSKESEKSTGGGISVYCLSIGGKGKSDESYSSTSRIKFTIPVALPECLDK